MAKLEDLLGLINVIQGVQGTKQKGKTSQTVQTQISPEGVQQLVRDILAGPGGVADIGSAARRSGLYNSTTEELLLGDLYSRAAVRAETAAAPTVTTGTQVQEQGGVGLETLGGVLLASDIVKDMLSANFGKSGAAVGKAIVDTMFGGQPAAPIVDIAQTAMAGGLSGAGVTTGVVPDAAQLSVSNLLRSGGETLSNVGTSAALSSSGGQVAGGALSRAGNFIGSNALPLGGSLLSGLLGGKDAVKDPKNAALTAAMGAVTMGPVGLVAAPIAALVGGLLKDGGLGIGSELKRTGRKVEKEIKRVGRRIGKIFGW